MHCDLFSIFYEGWLAEVKAGGSRIGQYILFIFYIELIQRRTIFASFDLVPRVLFEAWTGADFVTVFSNERNMHEVGTILASFVQVSTNIDIFCYFLAFTLLLQE